MMANGQILRFGLVLAVFAGSMGNCATILCQKADGGPIEVTLSGHCNNGLPLLQPRPAADPTPCDGPSASVAECPCVDVSLSDVHPVQGSLGRPHLDLAAAALPDVPAAVPVLMEEPAAARLPHDRPAPSRTESAVLRI